MSAMSQKIHFTNEVTGTLDRIVAEASPAGVFVLTDTNTEKAVLPMLRAESAVVRNARVITVAADDENKNLNAVASIWKALTENGASRKSLLINAGGGMVTDIGGFAASTYQRGIRFINVPTTLLGAVDAAVGGKTGMNFMGLKNQIGAFSEATDVIISTVFFPTLSHQEMLSGYAEMIKHGLISGEEDFRRTLAYPISDEPSDPLILLDLLKESVEIKADIVANDPHESGMRKALNLGHTAGHAFEELAMERRSPIPHGFAVAYGLVVAAILSNMRFGFPSETLHVLSDYVKRNYSVFAMTCDDYPRLLELMSHDKKNPDPTKIAFTLLRKPGEVEINSITERKDIEAALDIYRDLAGL